MTAPPVSRAVSSTVSSTASRAAVALVVGVVALAVGVVVLVTVLGRGTGAGPASPVQVAVEPVADRALVADRPEVRAAALLRAWDLRRGQAWAAGDPVALRALYVAGASAGRADARMLARWTRRGLRVHDLGAQLLRVRVLGHREDRWELEVVDRMRGGRGVAADGTVLALPRDRARLTRVVLVRGPAGAWVVQRVSAARSAAPP